MSAKTRSAKSAIPIGKVPPALLRRLLDLPRKTCSDLVLPPALGEDAAVVRIGRRLVAIGTDPITFPTPRPGFFAVHVNANDIAVTGAVPSFFTLTVLMPPRSTERQIVDLVADAMQAADSLGIVLVGGHTEVTAAVRLAVVSVTMFGELRGRAPVRTGDGRPGDAVIQVNPLGIEGTAILAAQHAERLAMRVGQGTVRRAARLSIDPGISVVRPALLAASRLKVHAMHDPTEGGIATGLREVALASGTGVRVREPDLIMLPVTRRICAELGVAPLGLISSGCLLLTVAERDAAPAVSALRRADFTAARIGSLTDCAGEFLLETANGQRQELPCFAVDELANRAV